MPLFRGPEILSAWRALLRDRLRDRKGRKKFPRTLWRTRAEVSVGKDRGSPQAADGTPLHRPRIAGFRHARGRLLGEPRAAARNGRAKSRQLPGARAIDRREG